MVDVVPLAIGAITRWLQMNSGEETVPVNWIFPGIIKPTVVIAQTVLTLGAETKYIYYITKSAPFAVCSRDFIHLS